jgi:hypothetical protein
MRGRETSKSPERRRKWMDVEKNIILGLDVLLGHQDEGDTLVGGIWEPKTKAVLVTSLCSGCSSFS